MRGRVPQLSDEQISEFKEAFSLFDRDGDGTITTDELAYMLSAIAVDAEPEEVAMLVREGDQSGNGVIDFPEFLDFMAVMLSKNDREALYRECFEVFDPADSGVLAPDALKQIIQRLGGISTS